MTQTLTTVNTLASPSTAWEEHCEPDEHQLFEDFANKFITGRQKDVSKQTNAPLLRGFHAKLHAGVLAEFHVLADLPAHARFGVRRLACGPLSGHHYLTIRRKLS